MKHENENEIAHMSMACLLLVIILLLVSLLMGACASPNVVPSDPVIEYRDRIEYRDKVDSVVVHDSSYIYIKEKGDTVYQTEYKYKYIYKYETSTDTICKVDSIPYPVIEEKVVVEYKTRGIVKLLAWIGMVALGGVGFWIYKKFFI